MQRLLAADIVSKIGEDVLVKGWVHARRDMGKIIFIDLRDRSGLLQVVFAPGDEALLKLADSLRSEYVVAIKGVAQKRPEKMVNPKIVTGTVELLAKSLEIFNEAKTPPFELDKDTRGVSEELRLKYRYLDLRTERMTRNLFLRHEAAQFMRRFLAERNFWEVETPILTKGTPEGSREYIVPARLHPGQFYVLPQSPQQFKQLLMVAGIERYMQIARCFRDEDQRGDRQPEFTQLDLEMSFVSEEDILSLIESLLIELAAKIAPEKHLTFSKFPRFSYAEAMKQYQSDKPDMRKDKNDPNELAFAWVVDFPLFEYSETEKRLVSAHHPFTSPKDEDAGLLKSAPETVRAKAYDIILNGCEIGGGSIRIHNRSLQEDIFKTLGLSEEEINDRFGHMLEAFTFGAPPHGGLALGIDRLIMILAEEHSIREVIAFPKTGDARDPMMDAPSELPESALREANIEVRRK